MTFYQSDEKWKTKKKREEKEREKKWNIISYQISLVVPFVSGTLYYGQSNGGCLMIKYHRGIVKTYTRPYSIYNRKLSETNKTEMAKANVMRFLGEQIQKAYIALVWLFLPSLQYFVVYTYVG